MQSLNDNAILLGVPLFRGSMEEAVDAVFSLLENRTEGPRIVVTVNVDFMVNTHCAWRHHAKSPRLLSIMRQAPLVTDDGMPLLYLARLIGVPLKERVTGADMVPAVIARAAQMEKSIYILGGEELITKEAIDVLKKANPSLIVAGMDSSRVSVTETAETEARSEERRVGKEC